MKKIIIICIAVLIFDSCVKVVDGFQDKISYYPEDEMEVFLNATSNKNVGVNLYDIHNDVVDYIKEDLVKQPSVDTNSWYEKGYQYKKSFSYNPNKLKSGIYRFEKSSPFIIKNSLKKNDVLVIYPSNTVNAYNRNGGRCTYTRPIGVSLSTRRPSGYQDETLGFLKWIEKEKFKVDYICDKDVDDYSNIENYKIIIVPGHSEYWSRLARRNFDKYIEYGGNAIILSGNTMWKQVRYEGDNVICHDQFYSDSMVVDSLRTSNYSLKQLNYPINNSIGANFVDGGYGLDKDNGWDGYKIISNSPLLRGTGIKKGDVISIPTKEYDGAPLLIIGDLPCLDTTKQIFYRQELIGFDKAFRIKETYGTFIVFQKTKSSGIIINTASTDWCDAGFSGKDGEKVKKLTFNFIDYLLNDKSVF